MKIIIVAVVATFVIAYIFSTACALYRKKKAKEIREIYKLLDEHIVELSGLRGATGTIHQRRAAEAMRNVKTQLELMALELEDTDE